MGWAPDGVQPRCAKTPPLIPAKAGTQCFGRFGGAETSPTKVPEIEHVKNWVPAFAGMSGREKRDQAPAFSRFRSGGVASSVRMRMASSRVTTSWAWLPRRRMATVPASASFRPTTAITGTLPTECSRTL